MTFDELLRLPQFTLAQTEKESILLRHMNELTDRHRRACPGYDRLVRGVSHLDSEARSMAEVPYVPVGLFKSHRLASVPDDQVFKVLTSSGTTGQQVSQIVLDRETATRQTTALSRIMMHVLGAERLPMILIESPNLIKDRKRFNARAAGTLGMMNFGRSHFYALDDDMQLDLDGLRAFLERFSGKPIVIFGFTFMVWQHLLEPIRGQGIDLSSAILIHSGGWKKLQEQAVSNQVFRDIFAKVCGLNRIYNFYGMVEQVGSVFLEGEDGFLYPPNFADVIVRDPFTFEPVPIGTPGLLQVLSVLPLSYPGHSILTEDMGVIHGIDDSECGRRGARFSVTGRVPKAELRGCSDVYASQVPA